jgi:quercetin dioxygenase-like cupin family protein
MFNDGRVKIVKMTLKKGASIGLHQHITSLEVIYVLSGIATSIVDGVKEEVEKGNVIYCPKTKMHTIKNCHDKNLVIFCVIPELEELK